MKNSIAHVLVVEHDAVITLDVLRMLRHLGAEATTANSGEQALKIVRQGRFDLIILDLNLPGINGLVVCRRLKKNPGLKDIPVIFLTGDTNPPLMDEAFRLGAVDFLTKPYETEELKKRVLVRLIRPFPWTIRRVASAQP